jgi:hypothetical protein
VGPFDPDASIAGLSSLELSAPPDHRRDPGQWDGDASVIDRWASQARADPQADRARGGTLDRELHAGGLSRRHAETGRALGGRKADQFYHPGTTRGYEVHRDLDLAKCDIERIGGGGAA